MNTTDFNDFVLSRALPLFNPTAVLSYTLKDLFKPGPQDALQSTLPFYELVIICIAYVIFVVLFIYLWKMVYFLVDDPYATPYGTAPPYEWRKLDLNAYAKILGDINNFMKKFQEL